MFLMLVVHYIVDLHQGLFLEVSQTIQNASNCFLKKSTLRIWWATFRKQLRYHSRLIFLFPLLFLFLLSLVSLKLLQQDAIAFLFHFHFLLQIWNSILELSLTGVLSHIFQLQQSVYLGHLILLTYLVLPSLSSQVDLETHITVSFKAKLLLKVSLFV